MSGGVPQGSVIVPTLWNILYDPVPGLGEYCTTLADDLSILVEEQLQKMAELAVLQIKIWIRRHELQLVPKKTEAVRDDKSRRNSFAGRKYCGSTKLKHQMCVDRRKTYF